MSESPERLPLAPVAESMMGLAMRPAIRITLLALTLAFLAYASVRVVHHQRPHPSPFHDLNQYGDGDWGVYYRAGLAMRLRRPLYTLEHGPLLTFKNPPAVALLIAPLSVLPVGLARWIWFVGDLLLLALLYRLAARVVFNRDDPPALRAVLIAGAVFLSLHYITDELFAGTTSLLYLLLTVGSFVWANEDKPLRAGAALALAVCLKVVPLAFLPWLALSRRPGRSLASFAVTLAILSLLPALWVGPSRNFELLRQWPRHLANTEVHVQELRPTNQSLNAMLTRLLTPGVPGLHRANIASISPRAAHALWLAATCALGAALYGWILLQRRKHRLDAAAVLSLLLLYMTLCNPLAWRYTYVATGIPILYCLHTLARRPKATRLILALLAASYLLHFAPELLQAFSARFWGAVALAGAVMLSRRVKGSLTCDPSQSTEAAANGKISPAVLTPSELDRPT
ncbi:MAG TPA: glycosyltransferase family 87 protein [Tepidisphaeraceae bacterium]